MTARVELERMVSDWLGTDVNTRIAAVPVDAGDPQPPPIASYGDSAYPTAGGLAVFDSTRHPWVADRKQPPAAPALYVIVRGPIFFDGEPEPTAHRRVTSVPAKVGVHYITGDADSANARRDGSYTMRAVARSLRALSRTMPLLRNGINVVLGQGPMEFYPVVEAVGNHRVSGSLVVNYLVRDQNPEYV